MTSKSGRRDPEGLESELPEGAEPGEEGAGEPSLDDQLDDALANTFPASDPVSLTAPPSRRSRRRRSTSLRP